MFLVWHPERVVEKVCEVSEGHVSHCMTFFVRARLFMQSLLCDQVLRREVPEEPLEGPQGEVSTLLTSLWLGVNDNPYFRSNVT